jgi:hypothetical protein
MTPVAGLRVPTLVHASNATSRRAASPHLAEPAPAPIVRTRTSDPSALTVSGPTAAAPALTPRDRTAVARALDAGSPLPVEPSSRAARSGPKAGASASARPGPQGPLGNNAKTVATAGQGPDEKRAEKWSALRRLGPITTLPRVSKCKRVSRIEGGEVHARYGQKASMAGLVTCGSVWACPVCSAVITAQRATELDKLVRWNAERGGSLALLTLTMRHHKGQSLTELRKGLTAAWRFVVQSRGWKDAKKVLGMDGYVRAIEVTYGEHGWHLHIHALLVFAGPLSDADGEFLAGEVWERWSTGLAREGLDAVREHAVDVRRGDQALETLGRYINKIVFEAVGGRWKKGHAEHGGRTPFQILAEGLATGNADDLETWLAWEQGSKGMRQLVWSQGLKTRVGVDEVSDEDLAEKVEPGATFAVLPRITWLQVYREGAEHLLDATEAGGPEAGRRWLDDRGLEYRAVEGLAGEDVDDAPTEVVSSRIRAGAGHARHNERVAQLSERLARYAPPPRWEHDEEDE